jgi:hypothetical protein
MDSLLLKAFKYSIFAVISTIFNLLFQYLSLLIYSYTAALFVAMLSGTFAGLFVKYILDKNYIFYYKSHGKKENYKKFLLYSLFSVFPTLIFWTSELVFHIIFEVSSAKYIGATFGLIIGYMLKYRLDKKFVF